MIQYTALKTTKESIVKEKETKDISGNQAEIRKALEEIADRLSYLFGHTDGTFNPPALKEVYEIAVHALAKPMRNCDRFRKWEDASKGFEEANKERIGFINMYTDVLKWLFATTEEGGADGK